MPRLENFSLSVLLTPPFITVDGFCSPNASPAPCLEPMAEELNPNECGPCRDFAVLQSLGFGTL